MSNATTKPYRGSEWGKWDLHVHTPASFHYEYDGADTFSKIIKKINESDIVAFAITDYFTLDGYKELVKNKYGIKKTLLPGIELRLEDSLLPSRHDRTDESDTPINIQLIFDNDPEIFAKIEEFVSNLEFNDFNEVSNALTKENIIALGRQTHREIDEQSAYIEGCKKIRISKKKIVDTLREKGLSNKLLIVLPYEKYGGIDPINPDNDSLIKSRFTKMAHIMESSKKEQIDFFLGNTEILRYVLQTGKKNPKFVNFIGKPKPSIQGSDSHHPDTVAVFKENKFCWIKADPTFEGLKQIIYEPEDRVKIQELKPEEKSDYNIIDRVEYKNFSGTEKQVVYFNQNLNSIIGSRATGKSNLLRNIAFSIDPEQCREKSVELKDFLQLKDFNVFWRDKKENTLTLGEDKEKGILFIPQRYLGELVYERGSQFDKFLTSLFENKDDFSQALQNYRKFENENILEMTSLIRELLAVRESGREKQSKVKKLGKKEEIESEIKKIDLKLNEINKTEKKITSKELESYKLLTTDKSKQERTLKILDRDITSLGLLREEELITAEKVFEFEFSQKYREKIEKKLKESDELFKKEFIELEIDNLKKDKNKLEKAISGIEAELKPLREKVEKHQALVELTKSLQDKKEALRSIVSLKKELDELRKIYESKQIETVEKYFLFNEQYRNLKLDIGVLEFSVVEITTSFDEGLFKSFIEENINYHNSTAFRKDEQKTYGEANNFLNDPVQWLYNKNQFSKLLRQLLLGILSGNLLLKSGRDEESILIELFKNRFKVNFLKSIKNKKGDEFEDMSDGEKALALLEFIFKFDDYNYPVLIDQPEDDLDAKTISKHIVDFIKKEKTKRQILVASHNANLVVCGDSEEVIVSNKSGGRNPNFKYPYGAIENQTIRDEIIEILEGGKEALAKRRDKLGLSTL